MRFPGGFGYAVDAVDSVSTVRGAIRCQEAGVLPIGSLGQGETDSCGFKMVPAFETEV